MDRVGVGGHKETKRTNFSLSEVEELLNRNVAKKQLELLRFRKTNPA